MMNKNLERILKRNTFFHGIMQRKKADAWHRTLAKLFKASTVQEKQIIFSSFQGRLYADSPRAIYEYMIKSPLFSDYSFVWAFNRPNEKADYFDLSRTRLVRYNSLEFFKALYSSKYWIFNFKTLAHFYKRENQIFLQ